MKKVILLFIILLTPSTLSFIEAKFGNGFSADLFHYHSPLSPFYNSSMTQAEILLKDALHSISRYNNLLNFTIGGNKAETVVLKDGMGAYIAKIFIGTPAVESFVSVDTASGLLWLQCMPCTNCLPQMPPSWIQANPQLTKFYPVTLILVDR
ncbi:hypothetical protein VNO77_27823 [Canavalia gladiata]|uniref:Peptidase A1 domain-containing protein n=1 Tax=Canavalia gladiata TaxID=3824 RepID=A0AAN9Q4G2_CANGL